MPLVWITGNSGAGKSTVCTLLRNRGHTAIDADDEGFSQWFDRATGEPVVDPPYPVPAGWLNQFGWKASRERVERLADRSRARVAFLCGSVENEAEIRDIFDVTVCLVIDDDTLRHRLASRTTNEFGKNPEELAAALQWNPRMRPAYERRGAVVIDATRPPAEVADRVLAAVHEDPA